MVPVSAENSPKLQHAEEPSTHYPGMLSHSVFMTPEVSGGTRATSGGDNAERQVTIVGSSGNYFQAAYQAPEVFVADIKERQNLGGNT